MYCWSSNYVDVKIGNGGEKIETIFAYADLLLFINVLINDLPRRTSTVKFLEITKVTPMQLFSIEMLMKTIRTNSTSAVTVTYQGYNAAEAYRRNYSVLDYILS